MNHKVEAIYKANKDHKKGYIVSIEDMLIYLTKNGYNWALGSNNMLIGNELKDLSYFEVGPIKLGKTIEEQTDKVITDLYNLIKE